MLDIEDIVKSWSKLLKPTLKEKEIARKRLEICNNCSSRKVGICTECGCFLEAKAFSEKDNSCPKKNW